MSPLSRRRFMESTAAAAACVGGGMFARADEATPAPPQVKLPGTDILMSRVGQGTGVHGHNRQSDQTRMGFEKLVALFRHAFDRGITFFDLADLYGTHVYFREALRSIPRERITILTKVWWRFDGPRDETSAPFRRQVAKQAVERFRHELTTDYLDIVLLHCLDNNSWQTDLGPYLEALKRRERTAANPRGRRFVPRFRRPESCRLIAVGRCDPGPNQSQRRQNGCSAARRDHVLRMAKDQGKAVLGMKILGEGQLADSAKPV